MGNSTLRFGLHLLDTSDINELYIMPSPSPPAQTLAPHQPTHSTPKHMNKDDFSSKTMSSCPPQKTRMNWLPNLKLNWEIFIHKIYYFYLFLLFFCLFYSLFSGNNNNNIIFLNAGFCRPLGSTTTAFLLFLPFYISMAQCFPASTLGSNPTRVTEYMVRSVSAKSAG